MAHVPPTVPHPRGPAGPATRLAKGIRTRPGARRVHRTSQSDPTHGAVVSPNRTEHKVADRETA